MPAVPEIFVLAATCAILIVDLFLKDSQRDLTYWLAQITVLGALVMTLGAYDPDAPLTFGGSFIGDAMAAVLKSFVYVVTASVFSIHVSI
jgi:NADH-quinone oxidoreductase subunit N